MRSKSLNFIVISAGILAVAVSYAPSASAMSFWQVESQELESGVSKEESILKSENYRLKVASTEIECTGQTAKGATIVGGEEGTGEATLELSGCKATSPCSVPSTLSIPTKSELVENTGESTVYDLLLAKSGTTLATIKLTGETCALAGSQALKGTVAGEVSQSEEATQQTILFPKTPIKEVLDRSGKAKSVGLTLGSTAATLLGASKMELASQQIMVPLIAFIGFMPTSEWTVNRTIKSITIRAFHAAVVNDLKIFWFMPVNVIAFMIQANTCEKSYVPTQECSIPIEFNGANAGVTYTNLLAVHPVGYPVDIYQTLAIKGKY